MTTVDVWHVSLQVDDEAARRQLREGDRVALDDNERARADRLRFPEHRLRYITAHVAVRLILARELGVQPQRVRLHASPSGKPEVVGQPLRFNLSHSGDRAMLAMTGRRSVGVDIERARPHALDAWVARRFAPREEHVLTGLSPGERGARFTTLWTRKEALAKALGAGITRMLHVEVGDDAAGGAGAVVLAGDDDALPHRVRDLPAPHGYRAAVALSEEGAYRVVEHHFDWCAALEGSPRC